MGKLIKGKPVADALSEKVMQNVQMLKSKRIYPKLAIMRIGENPSDLAYEKGAVKRCESLGIDVAINEFPKDISQEEFAARLKEANEDAAVNGILIFRPLPKHINENVLKYVIDPEKDVDCFSPVNVAKLMENDKTGFAPCTPSAVMEILKFYDVPLKGRNAVVVGRSMVVGKPVSMLLLNEDATVTICHSKTDNLPGICSNADILIAGIGRAKMLDSKYVKEGAVVIDVGINVDQEGNLCGDVDTSDCLEKASMITPVPAGVGSVTTSVLAKHVVKACMQQNNIE